jgi:hypothetical protein
LHTVRAVYVPTDDTIIRRINIDPGHNYHADIIFAANIWTGGGGTYDSWLIKIDNSDSLVADCAGFYFWILNNTGGPVTVSSITVTWTAPPVAYYRYVIWDGAIVFDSPNAKAASGETVTFTAPQTILQGQSIRIDIDFFKSQPTGGSNVDMNNVDFTIDLSDGSSFDVSTGGCP